MPKRPCPFEDSFQPQLKVHIRPHHVNEGVMKKTKMAEVYDRTIKMLFSGSQRQSQASLDRLNNNSDGKGAPASSESTQLQLPLHQMEITADGRLALPPKVCGNSANVKKQFLSEYPSSCAYCDSIPLCAQLRPCSECAQEFCPSCSFSEYHDEEEQRVKCLSCF